MRIVLLLGSSLWLAGCNSEPEVSLRNASVEDVANEVTATAGGQVLLQPGQWQTKVTIEDISIPGMPASTAAQMKGMFAQQRNATIDYCLTPEEAKRPGGKFFTGEETKNCRYDHFTMSGGKVDALMRCEGEQSAQMTMKMSGSYKPNSSTTRSEMEITGGRDGKMTIKATSEARRTGECKQKEGNG